MSASQSQLLARCRAERKSLRDEISRLGELIRQRDATIEAQNSALQTANIKYYSAKLNLRDQYASAALSGLLAVGENGPHVVQLAFQYADDMLGLRK